MFVFVCACVHAGVTVSAENAVDRRLIDPRNLHTERDQVTRTLAPADCGSLSRVV